jgi:hypothetical protein
MVIPDLSASPLVVLTRAHLAIFTSALLLAELVAVMS